MQSRPFETRLIKLLFLGGCFSALLLLSCKLRNTIDAQGTELVTSQIDQKNRYNYEVFSYKPNPEKKGPSPNTEGYLVRTICTRPFSNAYDVRLDPPEYITKENCAEDAQEVPLAEFEIQFLKSSKEATESHSTAALLAQAKALNEMRDEHLWLLKQAQIPETDPLLRAQNSQNATEFQQEVDRLTQKIDFLTGGATQIASLFENLKSNWNHYLQNWVKGDLPILIHKKSSLLSDNYDAKNILMPSSVQILADVVRLSFDRTLDSLVQSGAIATLTSSDPRKWEFREFLAKNELSIKLDWNEWSSQNKSFMVFTSGLTPMNSWSEIGLRSVDFMDNAKKSKGPICKLFGPQINGYNDTLTEKSTIKISGEFIHSPQVEVLKDFPLFSLKRKSEAVSIGEVTRISMSCGFLTNYSIEEVVQKIGLFKKRPFKYIRFVGMDQNIFANERNKFFTYNEFEGIFGKGNVSFKTLGEGK
jgi:hypothetical protein